MINKTFVKKLKKDHDQHNSERRQIINLSKRVIFSLHRGNVEKAKEALGGIEKILLQLESKFSHYRINEEGAYRAGVEEYVEAKTFWQVINGEKIDLFKNIKINYDGYLAGLCDLTGELVRRAVNYAAQGDVDEVVRLKDIINAIMEEMVEFDMTGYLRTKYDQAKSSLKKIEQIVYDLKIRQ